MYRKFKFKVSFLAFMLIAALSFTQNVSAKKCMYTIGEENKIVTVSYGDSRLSYVIEYNSQRYEQTFTKSGDAIGVRETSTYSFENKIPLSEWINNGCMRNFYVAKGTVASGRKDVYVFTNNSNTVDIQSGTTGIIPVQAIYRSEEADMKVTLKNMDGSTKTIQVDFDQTIAEPEAPQVYEDKNFKCWAKSGSLSCFDFSTPITSDITLTALYTDMAIEDSGFKYENYIVYCNGEELPYGLPYIVSQIIKIFKIFTPIILIVLGMIDFGKAVVASDEKRMKEASSKFIRRALAAVIVFFVISIVQFAFSILGEASDGAFTCFDCFINGCEPIEKTS